MIHLTTRKESSLLMTLALALNGDQHLQLDVHSIYGISRVLRLPWYAYTLCNLAARHVA